MENSSVNHSMVLLFKITEWGPSSSLFYILYVLHQLVLLFFLQAALSNLKQQDWLKVDFSNIFQMGQWKQFCK